jgi:hypothetical protein
VSPLDLLKFLTGLLWQFLFPSPAQRLVILMSATMNSEQTVIATVKALTAKGNPTSLPGQPTWSVPTALVVGLTPSADGSTCAVAGIAAGTAPVTVTAGGLSVSDNVTVTPAPAAKLVLEFGTPA